MQIDLDSGRLLDSLTLRREHVEMARHQGLTLRGQLLLVLGVRGAGCCYVAIYLDPSGGCLDAQGHPTSVSLQTMHAHSSDPMQLVSQTLHVIQVAPAGRLVYLHAMGRHCRVREGGEGGRH